ncbi:MAG: four helix bundle protein [bacterium]
MKDGTAGFENMIVWKDSFKLSVEIYKLLKETREFGIRDQMIRSSLSIPSNIAEGHDRNTDKEFVRFLNIAKASCGELRTQVKFCIEIGLIEKEKGLELISKTQKISSMLFNLIKSIKLKQ